ncbi:hypothetical protein [Parachryseolinea silvisoli]|uniref:hypothetical protein n=1 Tax=Parachryseolinea silvisoli TaxID=2873601 RepID=UPI002265E621|nr:hypothetical protein [Parachryseolinea silvisoli]MCD9020098.1 hypothetical protein [Parachryseolinea silvisoli]
MRFSCCLFILALLASCSPMAIVDLRDEAHFTECPTIVKTGNRYFIRFRYADKENLPLYFMTVRSRIMADKLVFFIPATASSGNMAGELQLEEITSRKQLDLIRSQHAFWKEVNGQLVTMPIRDADETDVALITSGDGYVYY